MKAICDMGPLQYLVLIGCEDVLPRLFDEVVTARVVVEKEMSDARTPELVRRWAAAPPSWLQIRDPSRLLEIPSLGRKGVRGDGDRAVISLAIEERADVLLMDDIRARKHFLREVKGMAEAERPKLLWMLELIDVAAERGLITDLVAKLDHLEHRTPYYVGDKAREVIEGMKERDLRRKQAQEQARQVEPQPREPLAPQPDPAPEQQPRHRRGRRL